MIWWKPTLGALVCIVTLYIYKRRNFLLSKLYELERWFDMNKLEIEKEKGEAILPVCNHDWIPGMTSPSKRVRICKKCGTTEDE